MRGWQGNKRYKRKKNKWGMCQKKKVPGKRTSRKGFGMIRKRRRRRRTQKGRKFCGRRKGPRKKQEASYHRCFTFTSSFRTKFLMW